MKNASFLYRLLIASMILSPLSAYSAVIADHQTTVGIQRSFVNLSFNEPTISGNHTQLSQDKVPGWKTTHSFWGSEGRLIEIWRAEGHSSAGVMPNASNDQYAELNAEEASALYQNVCLFQGESFDWSFKHAARQSGDVQETAEFLIGTVNDSIAGNAKYSVNSLQSIYTSTSIRSQTGRWVTRSGSIVVGDKIPKDGGIYSFIFRATNGSTLGNFLDDIKIGLKPAVEFSANNGEFIENSTEIQPINFKIVGQILSANDMPTLKLKVEYPSSIEDKRRAVYNKDYELYKRVGNQYVALSTLDELVVDAQTNNITFKYKPDFNTELDYTKGIEVSGLAIKLKDNFSADGDKFLPFSFALDKDSNAIATSLTKCDMASSIQNFELVIADNDIDLDVKKQLITEAPQPGGDLTYSIELENKTEGNALGVVLKDTFLANLLNKNSVAELSCSVLENDSKTATCPEFENAKAAATQLLSKEGLKIGKVSGKAKLVFTLSKIKLNTTDNSQGEYAAYFANQVEVTTSSNDFDLTNNIAIAKNLYPAKSDLMNSDTTQTGTGVFVIDHSGKALWEKTVVESKAYFPLKIKNHAKLEQDYKLYASRTAIAPLIANQELSPLKVDGVNPYTEQLKVEFFDAKEAECKDKMPSAQQITQITVPAESTTDVCAVISLYPSATSQHNIWFAIQSIQTDFGDIILDAVNSTPFVQRLLELVNDQKAQVNIGGSFVFLHRLFNKGTLDESEISLKLTPIAEDGFLYTLFLDKNNDGKLDASDTIIHSLDQKVALQKNQNLQLLVKVQAPNTATNGMMSQIKLEVIPNNVSQSILLESLINTDTVYVGSDQVQVTKMQYKNTNCKVMTKDEIQSVSYKISSETIGANDCLLYRISVKNIGSEKIKNIDVQDMYPAYTKKWISSQNLPMTSTGEKVIDDGAQIKTTILELLSQQEKHLYFGIKLQ